MKAQSLSLVLNFQAGRFLVTWVRPPVLSAAHIAIYKNMKPVQRRCICLCNRLINAMPLFLWAGRGDCVRSVWAFLLPFFCLFTGQSGGRLFPYYIKVVTTLKINSDDIWILSSSVVCALRSECCLHIRKQVRCLQASRKKMNHDLVDTFIRD